MLAIEQVGVDSERARREVELEDLHRQRKEIFGVLPTHPAERDALAAFDLREPRARESAQMFAHSVLAHAERTADAAAGLADERRDEKVEIREVCEDHQRARSQRVVEQTIRQREVILERAAPGVWVVGQVVTNFRFVLTCRVRIRSCLWPCVTSGVVIRAWRAPVPVTIMATASPFGVSFPATVFGCGAACYHLAFKKILTFLPVCVRLTLSIIICRI